MLRFMSTRAARALALAAFAPTVIAANYDFFWRGEGADGWCAQWSWKYTFHPLDPPPPAVYPITLDDNATVDADSPLTLIQMFQPSMEYNCSTVFGQADINNFTIRSSTRLYGGFSGVQVTSCKRFDVRGSEFQLVNGTVFTRD